MTLTRPDILIIGAGVLGSSVAWHLSKLGQGDITVIDLDLAGTYSSSELNAGGCRATWWNPVNVEFAWQSMKFYESIAKEIQFFQRGYLFLYNQTKWKIAQGKSSLYRRMGIPIRFLDPGEIPEFLPEFENLKGVAGASYSPKDGLFDPHLLREYYRQGSKEAGVHFLDRRYVTGIEHSDKKIKTVHTLHGEKTIKEEDLERILTTHQVNSQEGWKEEIFQPKVVVNCTGAWLPITSKLYRSPAPIRPVRRQISLFSTHEEDMSDRGMMVDSSGLYMHPEGSHTGLVLAGYSNRDEKPGYRFDYDGESFFDRRIWMRLYRRGGRNHFSAIKHVRGWAGLYAVPPDNTGILWRVAPFDNLYELGAATGRGVMQSYALGRAMAELIYGGAFATLDATLLSGNRFQSGNFQSENLDI